MIISIGLLVYALYTFVRSRSEHSPRLLRKSFKIAAFPLLYNLGVAVPLVVIDRKNIRESERLAADAVGIYQYTGTDSVRVNVTLKSFSPYPVYSQGFHRAG